MTAADYNPLTPLPVLSLPGALEMEVPDPEAHYNLRFRATSLPAVANAVGLVLPERMGAITTSGQIKAISVGPDEWMLSGPFAAGDELKQRLAAAACTTVMSLVDVSDRACSLRVVGQKAAYAIKAACPHDVAAMPVNTATRTLFEQAAVLIERESETSFRIEMLRSWSVYVSSLLAIIGREIATGL